MRFQAAPISTLPAKILKSGPPLLETSSGENFALVLSCSVLMKPLRVPSSAFVKVPMLAIVILLWFFVWPRPSQPRWRSTAGGDLARSRTARNAEEDGEGRSFFDSRGRRAA